MNDETAKALIDALNRCSAALERASFGISVYHHTVQPPLPVYQTFPTNWPPTHWPPNITCGSTGVAS